MQSLFQNVIEVTLTTSAVIAVLFLLLPLICKNYTVKWRYWVWLVLAVRLLIPFSPSLSQTPIEITPPSQNIAFEVPVQNMMPSPMFNNAIVPQAAKDLTVARTITLNEILPIVWILGIVAFMLYHLAGYFLFKRSVLRFSRPVKDMQTKMLWCEVKEEMKTGKNIRILTCNKVKSPMMTGFFKPVLLLPDLGFGNSDLKIILKHELIHYKRRDIWYKLLLTCANAVHWFNPLIYCMVAMSNKDIEMACDSEVIRDSDAAFRKQYSETILSAIHKGNLRRTAFSTCFYGGKKTMKERFINIFDMRKKRKGIIALCAIAIIVGVSGAAIAYGVYTDFTRINAGTFSISVPRDWTVEMHLDGSLLFKKNNEEIGSFMRLGYDPSLPLSQFEGNHAETLSTKQLEGFSYQATEVMIRRTQPAAAMDTSYVDELHIYLIPENCKFAYDLYLDSSMVDEKIAIKIAKSVILNINHTQQILDIAEKWAEAVKNRDGKAQYDLLSAERQAAVYDEYDANHWTTGTSSPWVESYEVKVGGNEAIITYDYATSTGSAGKYRQTLSFIVEDGTYYIDYFTKPENIEMMSILAGDLIGTIKKNQTQLHAMSVDDGMISGIMVSIGDKKKSFPWKTLASRSFVPELSYADVDRDNEDELIIILCTGEGTGVLIKDIHVIKPDDFSEIAVENPLDALKSRVHTQITEKDVQITIDQKPPIVFPESEVINQIAEKERWFENLTMGSIVDYEMDNNRITARLGAQLSPAGFFGDFILTFEFTDHELKVSDIMFSSYIER
jgi:beta-lactamase regulating signal transducer with metallopeptidase domain